MDWGKLLVHAIDGKEVSFLVDEYHQRISRNLIFFLLFLSPNWVILRYAISLTWYHVKH